MPGAPRRGVLPPAKRSEALGRRPLPCQALHPGHAPSTQHLVKRVQMWYTEA